MRIPYIPSAYEKRLSMLDRKRFLLRSVRLAIRQAKEKEKKQRKSTETKPGEQTDKNRMRKRPKSSTAGKSGKNLRKRPFKEEKMKRKDDFEAFFGRMR